jgi:hypothetical protein
VRRGAKFGAKAGAVFWVLIYLGMLVVACVVPDVREHALAEIERGFDTWDGLQLIGSAIATCCLMMLYGVIVGVFVMGFAGLLRVEQDRKIEADVVAPISSP